jgi:hypothetical protein
MTTGVLLLFTSCTRLNLEVFVGWLYGHKLRHALDTFNTRDDDGIVLKSFYTVLLDEITKKLVPL